MITMREARFVVHKHRATHLHYDLRLEMDGLLKSWAVPKEPPLQKGEKRLAIQVEDHDIGYISFKGEIPKGQYGAGRVEIWDKGTYRLEREDRGKIELTFEGGKLRGRYVLLPFKKAGEMGWLFFKV